MLSTLLLYRGFFFLNYTVSIYSAIMETITCRSTDYEVKLEIPGIRRSHDAVSKKFCLCVSICSDL
jgi:hypothetical protein